MKTVKLLPPAEFLRECFQYDPESGALHWKKRPLSHFVSEGSHASFNTRFANKPALISGAPDHLRGSLTYNGVRRSYLTHRVIWKLVTGVEPEFEIDHENLVRTDNHWTNLRSATSGQNLMNKKVRRDSTTGMKGVIQSNGSPRFQARIQADGRFYHLGTFETAEQAAEAYRQKAIELHGKFARA